MIKRLFEEHKRKISKGLKGHKCSEVTKLKINWKNLEFKERMMKIQRKGYQHKPNKKEIYLNSIIQKLTNQYRINLSPNITLINGRIPDWINVNGEKKVILLNGIYWHLLKQQKLNSNLTKKQVEEQERKPYEDYGFKVLHVWEDELNNKELVINKLRDFI